MWMLYQHKAEMMNNKTFGINIGNTRIEIQAWPVVGFSIEKSPEKFCIDFLWFSLVISNIAKLEVERKRILSK